MTIARGMLRGAKVATLRCARWGGVGRWLRNSEWRRRRLLILCYHGVALDDEHRWSDLYVDEAHLRQRFSFLRRHSYSVLPLDDALKMLKAGSLPDRSVSITFDDGFYDFYSRAYPLLQEFGYHATLYLTTYYSLFQRPVFDPVASYLLWKGRGGTIRLGAILGGQEVEIGQQEEERRKLHEELRAFATANRLSATEKDELVRRLAQEVGVDFEEILARRLLHLMTPAEIASLESESVNVELHTHRHRTPRDRALFLKEIADNREVIQTMRPSTERLRHFCYPSGDYSREFLDWLLDAGIESAATCDTQIATRSTNLLLLPRLVDTMGLSEVVFEGWLSGVAALLPQAERPAPAQWK